MLPNLRIRKDYLSTLVQGTAKQFAFIYILKHSTEDVFYIGTTENLEFRMMNHCRDGLHFMYVWDLILVAPNKSRFLFEALLTKHAKTESWALVNGQKGRPKHHRPHHIKLNNDDLNILSTDEIQDWLSSLRSKHTKHVYRHHMIYFFRWLRQVKKLSISPSGMLTAYRSCLSNQSFPIRLHWSVLIGEFSKSRMPTSTDSWESSQDKLDPQNMAQTYSAIGNFFKFHGLPLHPPKTVLRHTNTDAVTDETFSALHSRH